MQCGSKRDGEGDAERFQFEVNEGAMGPTDTVLLLDGALLPASVGVVRDGQLAVAKVLPEPKDERSDFLNAVSEVMQEAEVAPRDLDAIAVCTGPGSFTGLRVAMGIASGMSEASGTPLYGVDAPRVIACAADAPLPVWTAVPWGRFRVLLAIATEQGPDPRSARLIALEDLPAETVLNGSRVIAPLGARAFNWPDECAPGLIKRPTVEAMAELALAGACHAIPARSLQPTYLVPPDAALPATRSLELPTVEPYRLGPADLEGLLALEQASFDHPWSKGMLAGELTGEPGHEAWGIRDEQGTLVACGLARVTDESIAILSVAVHPTGRGRGYARSIVQHLLRRGLEQGVQRADLEVETTNQRAIDLYSASGFVPVGVRRHYYASGGDALLMSLMLRRAL
ncbi:MAG: tRNA (adenosine(37)-N6)-threonylcarbamoyltransferase complex dimerization subunit type 1 TsaB [Acidobacteriota bacterium]